MSQVDRLDEPKGIFNGSGFGCTNKKAPVGSQEEIERVKVGPGTQVDQYIFKGQLFDGVDQLQFLSIEQVGNLHGAIAGADKK